MSQYTTPFLFSSRQMTSLLFLILLNTSQALKSLFFSSIHQTFTLVSVTTRAHYPCDIGRFDRSPMALKRVILNMTPIKQAFRTPTMHL